ncbi:hypothetical protein ACOMHN_040920 [Nucella lapillus]
MASTTAAWSSTEEEAGREFASQLSILHIVLIAFGGVVFIIGIVVIVVLLKSRKKLCANGREGGGAASNVTQIGQPPIYVIGQENRQGRGGDNPAFSRSDETNNSALPSRGQVTHAITRLPTYEEVMSGRVPSAPLSRSQQRSNIRVSQLQYQRGGAATTTTTTTASMPNNATDSCQRAPRRSETPPPRYAYEYPSCFWEEVPPPPYPSGNYGIVRAMGGGGPRGSTRSNVEERPPPFTAAVTVHRNYSSRNPRRAPLAVPTPTALSPASSPAALSRNHTLTSGRGQAVPSSAAPPSPLLQLPTLSGREVTRPLASSSPAVPRRQLTPAPVPTPAAVPMIVVHAPASRGGVPHSSLSAHNNAVSRSRSEEVRGQGQRCGGVGGVGVVSAAGLPVYETRGAVTPSAPLAR